MRQTRQLERRKLESLLALARYVRPQINAFKSLSVACWARTHRNHCGKPREREFIYNRSIIMLPDFPKVKEVLVAHATAYLEQLIRQEPILRGIRRVHHFEGSEMRTEPSTGPVQSSAYEHYKSANIEVPTDAIIAKGPSAFFEQVRVLAEDLKAHQVRTMLARVGEAADSVGNVVHGGGEPYGPDLFLEMLEKITISFDDDGNPQMPMAVVSPETGACIREHAAEWEADSKFRERHARILQRKREEWDDRERHRELVD